MFTPRRSAQHTGLPIHRSLHCGRRSGRKLCGCNQSHLVGRALAIADDVITRHQRVSRPTNSARNASLRGRPCRTILQSGRAGEPAGGPHRGHAVGERTRALAEQSKPCRRFVKRCRRCPARTKLAKLAADLPGLWQASTTSYKDRKRLQRTLTVDITVLPKTTAARTGSGINRYAAGSDEVSVARFTPELSSAARRRQWK